MSTQLKASIRAIYSRKPQGSLRSFPEPFDWMNSSFCIPERQEKKSNKSAFLENAPETLLFPNEKKLFVGPVLQKLETGDVTTPDFRRFLADLECVPFGKYASKICSRLFSFVQRNLGVQNYPEIIALGCVIRKMVFNFSEEELPQVEKLLTQARVLGVDGQSTKVEKILCKAVVARFQACPHVYNSVLGGVSRQLLSLINELGPLLTTKSDKITKVTFLNAVLGFACYANPVDMESFSSHFVIPNSIVRLLRSFGEDIQKAIDEKMAMEASYPDILGFIQKLEKKAA